MSNCSGFGTWRRHLAPSEGDYAQRIDMRGVSAVLERVDIPGLLERGCVNVIGIEPVQEKLGARWPRMQDHVHERVQKYIARRLASSEYYANCISDVQYHYFHAGRRCAIRFAIAQFPHSRRNPHNACRPLRGRAGQNRIRRRRGGKLSRYPFRRCVGAGECGFVECIQGGGHARRRRRAVPATAHAHDSSRREGIASAIQFSPRLGFAPRSHFIVRIANDRRARPEPEQGR